MQTDDRWIDRQTDRQVADGLIYRKTDGGEFDVIPSTINSQHVF